MVKYSILGDIKMITDAFKAALQMTLKQLFFCERNIDAGGAAMYYDVLNASC